MAIPSHTVRRGARTFVLGMAAYALAVVAATLAVNAIDPAYAGLPAPHAFVVFSAAWASYALAGYVAQRRYR